MKFVKIMLYAFLSSSVVFLLGCTTLTQSDHKVAPSLTASAALDGNLYDSYMAEERQWAGLISKKIQVREGLEISYSEGGNLNAPVLVLLHGYYGDRNNWNQVANQLQNEYHLIIPDLPGHGDSGPHPEAIYTFAEMSFVMHEFMQLLGISSFHLAGHSMGGAVAIQWSMAHQSQINSLTLLDSAGKYLNNKSEIMQKMLAGNNPMRISKPGDAKKVMNFAMAKPPFVPARVMLDYEKKQLARTPTYDKVMADMLSRNKTLDVRFFYAALRLFDKPTLVIWGEKDKIFSVDVTNELMDNLPNAQLVILKDVGHTPLLEAPWPTTNAIRGFLENSAAVKNLLEPESL